MSPYIFDLIVIVLVLLSAGLGFLRGFCNEIFTIFGWIGAVVATILLTPVSRGLLKDHIHNEIVAGFVMAAGIFIVTMVLFSIVSHYATRSLQAGKLGTVDRSLGFGFGLLRGVLFIGLMYLLIAYVFPSDNRPVFITDAKTRPILEASAHLAQFVLPGDVMIDIDGTGTPHSADGLAQTDHSPQNAEDRPDETDMPNKDVVTEFRQQVKDAAGMSATDTPKQEKTP